LARAGPLLLDGGDHEPFCGLWEVVNPWSEGSVGSMVVGGLGGGVFEDVTERRDEEKRGVANTLNTSL
jgi:hypothetical protein